MILHELCNYYDRLASDPNSGIAPMGFSVQKIAFEVVIREDGSLIGIHDLRESDGKNLRSHPMVVPGAAKPSGSGLNPSLFGWDRTDYMLGYVNLETIAEADREKKTARCAGAHQAYIEAMFALEPEIDTPAFSAFCVFLSTWDLAAADLSVLEDVSGCFGVVRVGRGTQAFLHDLPALQARISGSHDGAVGTCLLTGEDAVIAATHTPKIQGVNGAQGAGALVVSFNFDAVESYGYKQSYNGPVGVESAFKYGTALNRLLERGGRHRVQVAGDTCVFWADAPSTAETLFDYCLEGPKKSEDEDTTRELAETMKQLVDGLERIPDADVGFNILCLAPNAGRISIRFWQTGTVAQQLGAVIQHQRELAIVSGPKDPRASASVAAAKGDRARHEGNSAATGRSAAA